VIELRLVSDVVKETGKRASLNVPGIKHPADIWITDE